MKTRDVEAMERMIEAALSVWPETLKTKPIWRVNQSRAVVLIFNKHMWTCDNSRSLSNKIVWIVDTFAEPYCDAVIEAMEQAEDQAENEN